MRSKLEREKDQTWLLRDKYQNQLPKNRNWERDLERLAKGEPLDYVIGWREFLGCRIDLRDQPLIPRAETEDWLRAFLEQNRPLAGSIKVLDMFAGSGCIGLAVLKHWPRATVTFVDKSPAAIKQIRRNLKINQIANGRVKIITSDVWQKVPKTSRYDFVLANPPYVPAFRWNKLSASVRNFEPKLAIVAGADGLSIIKKFLSGLGSHLAPGARVVLEFDLTQKKWLEVELKKRKFLNIKFQRDQFRRWRSVTFQASN